MQAAAVNALLSVTPICDILGSIDSTKKIKCLIHPSNLQTSYPRSHFVSCILNTISSPHLTDDQSVNCITLI